MIFLGISNSENRKKIKTESDLKAWNWLCPMENGTRELSVIPDQVKTRRIPIKLHNFSICQMKKARVTIVGFLSQRSEIKKSFLILLKGKSFCYLINPLFAKLVRSGDRIKKRKNSANIQLSWPQDCSIILIYHSMKTKL